MSRCLSPFRKTHLWSMIAVVALAASPAAAQSKAEEPSWPRIDVAVSYQVDPDFFQRPAGMEWGQTPAVVVDAKDQIWVFTRAQVPVQVYSPAGKLVRAWGEGLIEAAHGLKLDAEGNVWLVDVGKHVVLKCTQDGKVLQTLGTPGVAGCDATHFYKPTDVAITPSGEIFVSDGYGNARVAHFDKSGKFVKQWGRQGTGPGEFSIVHAIALDSQGRLYVADRNNVRVQVFDQSGKLLDQWANLLVPWTFCVTANDDIWVCGSTPMVWEGELPLGCPPKDQVFMKFNPQGKLLQLWGVPKGEDGKEMPGELNWIHSIALDSKGNIYAGDIQGKRVQKFVRKAGK